MQYDGALITDDDPDSSEGGPCADTGRTAAYKPKREASEALTLNF